MITTVNLVDSDHHIQLHIFFLVCDENFEDLLLRVNTTVLLTNPGVGSGNLLQDSCLENSMDRGACQPLVCLWGQKELDMTEPLTVINYSHCAVHYIAKIYLS